MEEKQTDVEMETPALPTPDWTVPPVIPADTPQILHSTPASTPELNNTFSEPTVTFHNCVTTVDLNTTLDLQKINARTRNSEYNPKRFHGLVMRLREPKTTALIFSNGKIVCTGAKNEQSALLASKKYARIVQKLGFSIRFDNFAVQNLVATCDLKFPIKLDGFVDFSNQFCKYEPELFPGVIFRMMKPRVCLLIFVNGKIVFTGSKTRQDIYDALNNITPTLRKFRTVCS